MVEKRIGLVFATFLEAQPFIEGFQMEHRIAKPFPVYQSGSMVLIISGMGKTSMAIASTYASLSLGPGLLCNLGACGATSGRSTIGSVYQIKKIFESDRVAAGSGGRRFLFPDTLPGLEERRLASQDHPVVTDEERRGLAPVADLVDMEGAAFIQTCRTLNCKGYIYKLVTDLPGTSDTSDIIDNMKATRGQLYDFFAHRLQGPLLQQLLLPDD